MTGSTRRVPSFFLLVPGPWSDAQGLVNHLRDYGIETQLRDGQLKADQIQVELIEDHRLAEGFSHGRHGPLPDALIQQVARHHRAALIELGFRLDQAPARVASLGRALKSAGGVAVRMEASGAAWTWEPWLDRLDSGRPAAIYSGAVIAVQGGDGTLFTCGMHQFDLPDAQIAMLDPAKAIGWLNAFNIYQLAESPALASGHTFRPSADAMRRTLERWPDHRHHPSDGRHNPFGIWRFLAPGDPGLEVSERVSVTMPSLVAILAGVERKSGRLSEGMVEELVATAPSIAMERADAIALERSRGYVDLVPELAWEQWQIVRETM